jgi:hypothetical protein
LKTPKGHFEKLIDLYYWRIGFMANYLPFY